MNTGGYRPWLLRVARLHNDGETTLVLAKERQVYGTWAVVSIFDALHLIEILYRIFKNTSGTFRSAERVPLSVAMSRS